MKLLIQRVTSASVTVGDQCIASIDKGLLVFVCILNEDTATHGDYLGAKLLTLRCFENQHEKLDHNIQDINGDILVVSQFTLAADCSKGRRPSFEKAAKPEMAQSLYNTFVGNLTKKYPKVKTGQFGAKMSVQIENDGPFTLLLSNP